MFKFSDNSIRNMSGVHPDLVLIFAETIVTSPIDFGVPFDGGVRSAVTQNLMFKAPGIKTNCDGYENISRHQIQPGELYGTALDFFAYINGEASWHPTHMAMIAGALLSTAARLERGGRITHGLEWGASFGSDDFTGWDGSHTELVK